MIIVMKPNAEESAVKKIITKLRKKAYIRIFPRAKKC